MRGQKMLVDYKKFVLMLEIGNCLYDLIDYEFYYYNHYGERVNKTLGMHAFSTICSWKQSNHFDIEILQVDTQKGTKDERFKARTKLFFLMLYDMFYYFRNELRKECTWIWTTSSGVNGYTIVGPNGGTIFLPAAGNRGMSSLSNDGKLGHYWSSTPDFSYDNSYSIRFTSGARNMCSDGRNGGKSIRPVME